jgi:Zn-dependent protease with chaperone function
MPVRKTKTNRRRFSEIDASCFQHPSDLEAMKKLARMPSVQRLMRRVSVSYMEKMFRLLNTAERVRVTPKQCPSIYNLFKESCSILDIPEVPEIYLATVYSTNAFSFGMEKYTVILTSGLVDLLTEEELLSVIGHELSHIKCNHMMYRTLLYLLAFVGVEIFGSLFKIAALTFLPLEMKLRSWERKAELSADRGSLLVVQNPDVVQSSLVKLAGASRSLFPSINMKEILKQANDLKDMDEVALLRAMKIYHTAFRSHPFPIVRIKELHNWSQSNQYQRILKGNYPRIKKGDPNDEDHSG